MFTGEYEIGENDNYSFAMQTLALKGETEPGWLAVVSSLNEYDKESLHSLTRPMRDAFARGLSLYCQRQREIRQSLHSERRAQAAELHDSLAQVLGYMRIRSARLQTLMDETCVQPHMKTISDDLADQTLVAYRQVRELIRTSRLNLREQSLDQMFINALEEFEQHSAIVFQLDNRCPDLSVNHRQLTQLSYIVREALANIVRHSHASHARIRLFRKHNKVRLTIEDNGRGIDRNQARSDSYGLTIMQERGEWWCTMHHRSSRRRRSSRQIRKERTCTRQDCLSGQDGGRTPILYGILPSQRSRVPTPGPCGAPLGSCSRCDRGSGEAAG